MPFITLDNAQLTTEIIENNKCSDIRNATQLAIIIAINFSFHNQEYQNFYFSNIEPHAKAFINECIKILIDKNNADPKLIHQKINEYIYGLINNKAYYNPTNNTKHFFKIFLDIHNGLIKKYNLLENTIENPIRNLESNSKHIKSSQGYLKIFQKSPCGANDGYIGFKLFNKFYLENEIPFKKLPIETIIKKAFCKYFTPHLIKASDSLNEFIINQISNILFKSNSSKINFIFNDDYKMFNDIKFYPDCEMLDLTLYKYSLLNLYIIKNPSLRNFIQDLIFNYFILGNVDIRSTNIVVQTYKTQDPINQADIYKIFDIKLIDKERLYDESAKNNLDLLKQNKSLKLTLQTLVISLGSQIKNSHFMIDYSSNLLVERSTGLAFKPQNIFNAIKLDADKYPYEFFMKHIIDQFSEQDLYKLTHDLINKFNANSKKIKESFKKDAITVKFNTDNSTQIINKSSLKESIFENINSLELLIEEEKNPNNLNNKKHYLNEFTTIEIESIQPAKKQCTRLAHSY